VLPAKAGTEPGGTSKQDASNARRIS